MSAPFARTARSARWDVVDVARGVAILAMILYHFAWDLSFLQLAPLKVVGDPLWNAFARAIAGSFLALAGFGLALAHADGFRPRAFALRLARIAAAALLVTVATRLAFPQSYVFFGILHAIAVCSLLALPFRRAPLWAVLLAAALAFAGPRFLTSPALDHPLLDWLGLGAREPVTNDYVPVFPWLAPVLLGLAAGRVLLHGRTGPVLARWRADAPALRAIAWSGRKSLPIYLLHQPVMLAVLFGVLQIAGPHPQAQAQAFLAQCTRECAEANADAAVCRAGCACMVDGLQGTGGLPRGAPEDEGRIQRLAQECLRRAPPDGGLVGSGGRD